MSEAEVVEGEGQETPTGEAEPGSWNERLDQAISDMGEGKEITLPGEEPTGESSESKAEEESAKPEGTAEGKEEPTGEEESEAGEEETPTTPKPYSIATGEGDEYDLDWPEGAKVSFKADGQIVEASFDELITHAQKGVHADRRLSQMGQDNKELRDELTALNEAVEQSEDVLRRILDNPEEYEKVRDATAKWRDPEYAEGQKAKAELDRRSKAEQEQAEESQKEAISQFWQGVAARITDSLDDYEYLADDDLDAIVHNYHAGYLRHRQEILDRAGELAEEHGLTEDQAKQAAEAQAMRWLTEDNLTATMQGMNDRYEKRLRPKRQERETEEAEAHNKQTEEKRQRSRRSTRPLKGGGAPPQPAGPAEGADELREGENAWDAAKRRVSEELNKARQPLAQ